MSQVIDYLEGHIAVIKTLLREQDQTIAAMAESIVACLENGGKLLLMGNGGSAADAQHFAAEMVGRFRAERPAIPAIALTTDTSILTAVGNDYGFERIFARQIEALARPGDAVLAISTSGESENLVRALQVAGQRGCRTLCLSGRDGGALARIADAALVVSCGETPHTQEAHLTVIHLLCQIIEERMSASPPKPNQL